MSSERYKLARGLIGLLVTLQRGKKSHYLTSAYDRIELGRRFGRFGSGVKGWVGLSKSVDDACEEFLEKYSRAYDCTPPSKYVSYVRRLAILAVTLDCMNNTLEDAGFVVHLSDGSSILEDRLNFVSDVFWLLSIGPDLILAGLKLRLSLVCYKGSPSRPVAVDASDVPLLTPSPTKKATPSSDAVHSAVPLSLGGAFVPLRSPKQVLASIEESRESPALTSPSPNEAEPVADSPGGVFDTDDGRSLWESSWSVVGLALDMCEAVYYVFGSDEDDDCSDGGVLVPAALQAACATASVMTTFFD